MKDSSHKIRKYLFIVIIVILVFPFIAGTFKIEILPLKGAITKAEDTKINVKDWFSGDYQIRKEKYLNESFGIRSIFIRINNQIAYSFFNNAKANGVVIGKNNYLYELNYINAYYGTDFVGTDSIRHRLERLKFIQDTLQKLNKEIIVVFAAGKGSFYPEYIPDSYKHEVGQTNYHTYIDIASKLGINHIDFNKYFMDNKFKSKYPLYPQYGIHWSIYGSWLVADSMIKYIEKARNIDMPEFECQKVILSQPKENDYDIGNGLNLLFNLRSFKMAYPQMKLEVDSNKVKPSILVISDSFYWLLYGYGFTNAFGENQFWFYNEEIYPGNKNGKLLAEQLDIKDEILKKDVIILMATEATLPELGWGFIEEAYTVFKALESPMDALAQSKLDKKIQAQIEQRIQQNIRVMKKDEKWMESIRQKAAAKNISVDSMLRLDAIWLLNL